MTVTRRPTQLFLVLLLVCLPALAGLDASAAPSQATDHPHAAFALKDDEDGDSNSGNDGDDESGNSDNDDASDDLDDGGSDQGSNDDDGDSGDGVDEDDSVGDDIDDTDSGGDGSDGSGSDDDADDSSGHGNDDFTQDDAIDDSDGRLADEIDDDDDETTDGFRAGQAIVHLQPTASIDGFNERHGTTTVAGILSANLFLVQLPADQSESDAMRALSADAETRWVELNYVSQAPEGRPGYFFVSGEATGEPGEPYAPRLIGATACATGAGAVVAVLDTGIDATHPVFAGRITDGGWNALNNSPDVADVGNGLDDDADGLVDEMVGHGTHVAGIIAQVAPGASILPIKVLGSDGAGDAFYVAAGIYYALDRGVDVINLSLSSTYDARVVAEAVATANEQGVVVVAAAGNAGTDRVLEFPAADTGVVAVAATDPEDVKTEFSNYGAQIDLSAPGDAIVSALPGGLYASWSGTSMSAPFVAAAAALLAEQQPDWHSSEIVRRLSDTAMALDAANPELAGQLGSGRLDLAAALDC